MDIEKLYQRLCEIQYEVSSNRIYNLLYYTHKSEEAHNIIMSWAAEQELQNREKISEQEVEIAKLKAMCYAYEKIIANSNFAPMIIKENEGDDTANLLEEAEQKTGRWIDTHDATKCYCLNCNVRIVDALGLKIEDAIDLQITPPPYCPNCGSPME